MPVVDVVFTIRGGRVPLDHGYLLFSALSERLPWLHARRDVGVFNLQGEGAELDTLRLSRGSLRIRCPAEVIPSLLPIAGQPLRIGNAGVTVGAPTIRVLDAVQSLSARMVTFKGACEPDEFHAATMKFLAELGCTATAVPGRRRIVTIADRKVIGFGLDVTGLSEQDSLTLQERGLGGRRHMGCGLFLPTPANVLAEGRRVRERGQR